MSEGRDEVVWYAAHVVMWVQFKEGPQDRIPVWENIYIVSGTSSKEARSKAERAGLMDAGDSNGSFRWGGRAATWVYGGIRKIVECVDPDTQPGDGTEISYSEYELSDKAALDAMIAGGPVNVSYEK